MKLFNKDHSICTKEQLLTWVKRRYSETLDLNFSQAGNELVPSLAQGIKENPSLLARNDLSACFQPN